MKKQLKSALKLTTPSVEGNLDSYIPNGDVQLTHSHASKDIQFTNVWFRYPHSHKDQWILRNFNLTIKAGESLGVVGESGCGKSTLTQLLFRFYDPQRGDITIGGISIKQFTLKSLRDNLGMVQQEPMLFNRSILNNIIYGKPEANTQEILEASEIANASSFIKTLDGDDTDYSALTDITDERYEHLPVGYRTM